MEEAGTTIREIKDFYKYDTKIPTADRWHSSVHPRVLQKHLEAWASLWRREQAGLDQPNHLIPFPRI